MSGITKYLRFTAIFLFLFCSSFGQDKKADSLLKILETAKEDTTKLTILSSLIENINDDNVWPKYNEKLLTLSKKLEQSDNELIRSNAIRNHGGALGNKGYLYRQQGDIEKALLYYDSSLKLYNSIRDKINIALALNNLGVVYNYQGNISKALDYYNRSLKIEEEVGNKTGMGTLYNNIADIYSKQGEMPKALEYFSKCLKIEEEIGNKIGVTTCLNNLAVIYSGQNKVEMAIDCFKRNLKILEEIGDKHSLAYTLNNLSTLQINEGSIKEGVENLQRSLRIMKEINDKKGIAASFNIMSHIYLKEKKLRLAVSYGDSSLSISKQLGFPQEISEGELTLSQINSEMGNFRDALKHYKQYVIYSDSINNEGTRKASVKSQLKYEYEKKELVLKEQQEKERAVAEEKNRFQRIVIWAVIVGLLLVIIFAAYVFRSLKITHKQKKLIEEKQKEILDSIHYAKRIQTALITPEKYIDKSLNKLQEDNKV